MKQFLRTDDTCTLCGKPATVTAPAQIDFMGRKIQIMAALCRTCDGKKDRDSLLKKHTAKIFGE